MLYKGMTFPGRVAGAFEKMLNEQAALGFEYVETYAVNPNRPQHLTVLFRAESDPTAGKKPAKAAAPKEEPTDVAKSTEAKAETTLPEAETVETKPVATKAKLPAKSKPGTRRGRTAAKKV